VLVQNILKIRTGNVPFPYRGTSPVRVSGTFLMLSGKNENNHTQLTLLYIYIDIVIYILL